MNLPGSCKLAAKVECDTTPNGSASNAESETSWTALRADSLWKTADRIEDTVIAGDTDEFLPGTQPAPKRAPFNSSRAAGGGGSGDHAALKKAECKHSPQHKMQTSHRPFHRRARAGGPVPKERTRTGKKQLVQDWTQPPQQRSEPRQPGRKRALKHQEAEAGVAAKRQTRWSMHSKRRRCCGNKPAQNARRRTTRPRTG